MESFEYPSSPRPTVSFAGRVILRNDLYHVLVAIILMVVSPILFLVFVTPQFSTIFLQALFIVLVCILMASTWICYASCFFMNPGIIPKGDDDLDVSDESNGESKVCVTCKIIKPERSKHCRHCNCCVEMMDHHCPWIGNCVGKRNYAIFYALSVSGSILSLVVFISTTALMVDKALETDLLSTLQGNVVIIVNQVIVFLLGWGMLGLCLFHSYLISRDVTTNEFLRGINPHEGKERNGFFSNCSRRLCQNEATESEERVRISTSEENVDRASV